MFTRYLLSGALLALVSAPAPAPAKAPAKQSAAFKRDFGRFIDELRATPHAPPGFVVVAFHEGDTVFEKAYGTRNISTGAPMTLDTPVYHASLTKVYTGLLAAMLHREGRLPLQTRLNDVWPGMTLPAPLNAADVTAAKLLSHSAGIYEGAVQYRSNITGQIVAAQVPELLSRYATPTPSFRYANFGPYTYSAMAEARTGETWHSTIHRRVLKPLGLTRTMTRVEDIPPGEAAHCHVIRGGKARAVPLKPTAVLNAAGGMYVSGRDTAKFLKVFATDGRSAGGKIDAETLRLTWQPQAVQKVDFGGLLRDSYGLGWDLGAYEGRRYASRSGGYHGCRSYALWVPELKFGVTVLSVGEVATHQMNIAMIMQAIDLWTQNPEAATRAVQRIGSFQDVAAKGTAKFQTLDPRLVNPAPLDAAVASAATGSYRNDRLGEAAISLEGGKLVLTSGVLKGDLVPQADGGFLFYDRAALDTQPLKFSGSRSGTYDSFLFDDDQYERMR